MCLVKYSGSPRQQFYASHKWHPFSSSHLALPPSSEQHGQSLPEAQPIHGNDIPELCAIDTELVRKRISAPAFKGKMVAAIVPDVKTFSWHLAKEEFVSNELYGKIPKVNGAIVGTEKGKRVWCIWARTWIDSDPQNTKDNALYILRLVVEDPEYHDFAEASESGVEAAKTSYISTATAALLSAAQIEASKWHIGKVVIWNPTSATLAAAKTLDSTVQVVHREEDSITSLRWYGQDPAEEVVWVDNEKYAWC